MYPKQSNKNYMDKNNSGFSPSNSGEISQSHLPPKASRTKVRDRDSHHFNAYIPGNIISSAHMVKNPVPLNHTPHIGHRDLQPLISVSDPRLDTVEDQRFLEGSQLASTRPSRELTLDVEDLNIPWNDLVLKERIGAGNSLPLVWITL